MASIESVDHRKQQRQRTRRTAGRQSGADLPPYRPEGNSGGMPGGASDGRAPWARRASVAAVAGFALLTSTMAPAVADEPPTDEELAELEDEIEELREDASDASQRHETLRRQEAAQREDLVSVRKDLRQERTRLSALQSMIGQHASSQYRAGGSSVGLATLMFAESPEVFMDSTALLGRGEMTAVQLLERSEESEEALTEHAEEAAELRATTAELSAEQNELREGIAEKLDEAEDQLAELEEAREQAEKDAELEQEREAEARDGECAVAVRDSDELAEPAVDEEWTAPLDEEYRLTAGYGNHGGRWADGHTGQDFAVPEGVPVLTIGDGTVVETGCSDGFGHSIVVEHDNGYYSQYAHLSTIAVEPGQEVGAGQRVGLSGNTGNSSGPHLHFEVRLTPYLGSGIDPVPWLGDHGVTL